MSGRLEKADITNADVREETDIKGFYQHLIICSQPRHRLVFTGSAVEIIGQQIIVGEYGLSQDLCDMDMMLFHRDIYVVTLNEAVPEQFHGPVIRKYSDGQHAGYVKFHDEKNSKELQRRNIQSILMGDVHGPALTLSSRKRMEIMKSIMSPHGWIGNENTKQFDGKISTDYVYAVHSQWWPLEANEWITRKRIYGLPTKSTIRDVIRYGCDFVPISHKHSHDANEWRFSFSKAELIIINSWTAVQRIIYRILHWFNKMIKSRNKDNVLCTYYFKTLMFWAIEDKPAEFWSDDVLVSSVFELLCELIQWLKIKFCPNYFIPSNNMMDQFTNAIVSATIEVTEEWYHLLQTMDTIDDVVYKIKAIEPFFNNKMYMIDAPMWIHASIMLLNRLQYGEENYTLDTRMTKSYQTLLQNMFSFEFLHIYKALGCQQEAESCITLLVGNNRLLKSTKHLINYTGFCQTIGNVVPIDSILVYGTFAAMFLISNKSNSQLLATSTAMEITVKSNCINTEKAKINHKCFLYGRSMDEAGRTQTQRTNSFKEPSGKKEIRRHVAEYIKTTTSNSERSFKTFPGMSPTVSTSWFINKAYLSNLYYTSQHDFHTTEETCDVIIYVSKQSVWNTVFSERYRVMLSTKWSAVWDEELQSILGFYSLCMFIFNKNNRHRSVYIGACPVHFACYLKFRCAADQLLIERWNKSCDETGEHLKKCEGYPESKLTMHLAIAVIKKKFEEKGCKYHGP